nr:uncharacterized protein LOC112022252 [Quercus suber]
MQIKDEGALTFLEKLKGDPNKRSRDKYCRFHRDHGHDTADCYYLKQQIEALIRQGKLQKFVNKDKADPAPQEHPPRRDHDHPRPPIGDIRMIVGGMATRPSKRARKTYLRMVQNVQVADPVRNVAQRESPVIEFSEEDARCIHHPHDDALVVSLRVGDYNLHRVLIDNGNLADILYYPAYQQMKISKEQLVPTNAPLVGFGGAKVFPLGAVTLAVTAGDYPQQITKDVTFLVVDHSSAYNAILGRPTLNAWKTATSTYHLMIKFPTECGVGELRGNQIAARECYVAMMEMNDHLQTINIEEHRSATEPAERLEEIPLNDSVPDQTTRIGTLASPTTRRTLAAFLKENRDVFA